MLISLFCTISFTILKGIYAIVFYMKLKHVYNDFKSFSFIIIIWFNENNKIIKHINFEN